MSSIYTGIMYTTIIKLKLLPYIVKGQNSLSIVFSSDWLLLLQCNFFNLNPDLLNSPFTLYYYIVLLSKYMHVTMWHTFLVFLHTLYLQDLAKPVFMILIVVNYIVFLVYHFCSHPSRVVPLAMEKKAKVRTKTCHFILICDSL